ncbi:MAG TPA: HAD-IIIA family hydrolase [Opitutaceae bacterium]|jgi:D-glycero-D-manno-heptose 1,7-bisphosphate phosphatase|nr:HAD-IIIA family hydrolase [Opitutaceae bacterium]
MGVDPVGSGGSGGAPRPVVFVDRDGTLNRPVVKDARPFAPVSVAEFELFPEVPSACRALAAAGYLIVVVTNQPDVGRGTLDQARVEEMHRLLLEQVPEISRIEVCYDPGRGEVSRRRKPEPGMIHDAAAALGADLARSWMVGDRWKDIDCGRRAGLRTIFIDQGYAEALRAPPDFTVTSFGQAADIILEEKRRDAPPGPRKG